jgi:hypothetical protein
MWSKKNSPDIRRGCFLPAMGTIIVFTAIHGIKKPFFITVIVFVKVIKTRQAAGKHTGGNFFTVGVNAKSIVGYIKNLYWYHAMYPAFVWFFAVLCMFFAFVESAMKPEYD